MVLAVCPSGDDNFFCSIDVERGNILRRRGLVSIKVAQGNSADRETHGRGCR